MTSPCPGDRRDRQRREIAALLAAGARQRAAGLALEHVACFPEDAHLLDETAASSDPPGAQPVP